MTHLTEAVVEEIYHENGPEHIRFLVEAPPDLPDFFEKPTNRAELKRLERLTDPVPKDGAYDLDRVPVRYDDGSWEIAWDELES